MPFLPLIIILEILSAGIILGTSFHPHTLSQAKQTIRHVLGVSTIAQDTTPTDSPTPDQSPPQTSSDQTTPTPIPQENTPTPSDIPQPTNSPDTATPQPISQPTVPPQITQPLLQNIEQITPINASPSTDQNVSTQPPSVVPSIPNQTNLLDQILSSPTPPQEVTPTQPTAQSQNAASSENAGQVSSQAVTTILNPDSMVAMPQEIDQQTVQKAEQQDQQIAVSQTSQQQNTLLLTFAKDSVKDITSNLKTNDFGTTSFVTQRLDNQVTTSINNLQTIPPSESKQAKQQVTNFCNQADLVLKSEQLAVPESAEQDVEIVRGKCLTLTQ